MTGNQLEVVLRRQMNSQLILQLKHLMKKKDLGFLQQMPLGRNLASL